MKKQRFLSIVTVIAVSAMAMVTAKAHAQSQTTWRTIGNTSATGQFVGTTDNSPLSFKTNNLERLLINPNGNIQVSTLAGAQPSVVGVAADGSLFRYIDPAIDSMFDCSTKLYRATGNYLTPNCFIGSTNKAPFRVFTNNTERMHFMETGNIGVGTVTPQVPFHVFSATNAELRVEGGGQGVYPMLGMWVGNGNQGIALADIRAGIGSGAIPELYIEVNDGGGTQSMKKVMRLDGLNAEINVPTGIGMSPLPHEQLSVGGSIKLIQAATPANSLRLGHNGTNATIDATGNNSGIILTAPSGTAAIQQSANPANSLRLGHNGATAFLETPNAPNARLVVNGGGARTDFGGTVLMTQNLGLGTLNFQDNANGKSYRLSVDGRIRCNEVKVYSGWADHVFEPGYTLRPLAEVEAYIAAHGHLPGLPSAAEVAREGVDVGAAQALLLEKIEELTLHLIRLERENKELRSNLSALKKKS